MFLVVKAASEYLGVGSWIDLGIFLCVGGGVYFGVLTSIDSFFRQTFYIVLVMLSHVSNCGSISCDSGTRLLYFGLIEKLDILK
jgi:hypothetical protein